MYYLIGFIAVSCYGSLTVINKVLQKDVPPFTYIAITMFFLTFFATCLSFIYERNTINLPQIIQTQWPLLIGFSIINLLGFSLLLLSLTKLSIFEYQVIGLLTPIIGSLLAFFILNETITYKQILGFVIAVTGCFVAFKK